MHVDPELLALLALGETAGTPEERAHVDACAECAGDVAELQLVVRAGREAGPDPLQRPRSAVWARIQEDLGLNASLTGVAAAEARQADPVDPAQADRPEAVSDTSSLRALLARMRASFPDTAAAHEVEPTAYAELKSVQPASAASAVATIRTDGYGRRILELALDAELPTAGLRQAWLVHRQDPDRRQSIGILDGPNGVWTVDQSIELHDFAILEVSEQQAGEPAYSGHAVVRGELTTTR